MNGGTISNSNQRFVEMVPRVHHDKDDDGETTLIEPLPTQKLESDDDNDNYECCSVSSSLWQRLGQEFKAQLRTSMPTMAGQLLYQFPWLISLHFVGTLGEEELAAAALSNTLCNVTGISLSVGLSSALTTLNGQARGNLMALQQQQQLPKTTKQEQDQNFDGEEADELLCETNGLNHHNTEVSPITGGDSGRPLPPIIYLYRGIMIQVLVVLPVGVWWMYGIRPALITLGQRPHLASMTEQYLRILVPGLWSYSINWTLTAWLQSLELASVPAYAACVGLLVHIPLNYLFVYGLQMGYLGCAMATVCFQLVQPVLMLTYLFYTSHGQHRVLQAMAASALGRTRLTWCKTEELLLAIASWRGICQYLSLALPGIVTVSEWWASEVCIFLSGRLQPRPSLALDGMSLYQSINSFCFMFPMACSVAGAARVGSLLGQGDFRQAAIASKVGVLCALLVSGIMGCLLWNLPHTLIPSFFTQERDVILETSYNIPLLSIYVVADGIQVALNGTIKGCGRQCVAMPIVIIAYWMVGVPLAYYLAFVRKDGVMCQDQSVCGDVALVLGMTVGTWVHMILLMGVVFLGTNWSLEARKARERMLVESHGDLKRPLELP